MTPQIDQQPHDAAAKIRRHGLRVTPQRRAILEAFDDDASGHPTADEVFARAAACLPELSRATVYNVLGEFTSHGLLQQLDGLGAARYDCNLDASHHHFHCVKCERLFDVSPPGADKLAAGVPGFLVQRSRILFEGVCPECLATQTAAKL